MFLGLFLQLLVSQILQKVGHGLHNGDEGGAGGGEGEQLVAEAKWSHQREDERDGEVLAADDALLQLLESLVPAERVEQVHQPALWTQ